MSLPTPLPSVILGTMPFGDTVSERDAAKITGLARERGVTSFDTADVYSAGESERILARILPPDDEHTLASKVGMQRLDGHAPLSAAGIRTSVEHSLGRLGRDRIDVLYFHKPDPDTPLEESLTAVAELVAEGKVAGLGFSNYAAWQAVDLVHTAERVGAPAPSVGQQQYNILSRRLEDEYVAFAEHYALPTAVYNPLAGGLLTGRYRSDAVPRTGRFGSASNAAFYRDRYWNPHMFAAVEQLTSFAESADLPMPELALRWLLSKPTVRSILVGASSTEQLTANLDAIERGPLPETLSDELDSIGAPLKGHMPSYNR